ncbi:MAG: hypothetical protein GY711_03155 [bacterium]|nr:hypothetical protein [bacterium]
MELRNSQQPGNGPERFRKPVAPDAAAEVREQLVKTQETTSSELAEARQRVERVKADAADRALRMPPGADKLDLSSAATALAADEGERDRADLVSELKAAYESGTLNGRSRIERAAQRLLGGE